MDATRDMDIRHYPSCVYENNLSITATRLDLKENRVSVRIMMFNYTLGIMLQNECNICDV